jgi:hypothetical protein
MSFVTPPHRLYLHRSLSCSKSAKICLLSNHHLSPEWLKLLHLPARRKYVNSSLLCSDLTIVQRQKALSIMTKGYSMNWTPQQLRQEIQYQAEVKEDEVLACCFGWFQLFTSPFVNTTSKSRPSRQCAGDPRSKPDRYMHSYTCTGCKESFLQPELRDWHVEKEHARESECCTTFDISSSPTRTQLVTSNNIVR